MPITIKELFPSDPLSEALEKINFNFDQLILAGGGPPGPAGPIGPQGVPGPLGLRGDHWFAGASAFGQTADHDGGDLRVQDHYLDILGDIYEYFDISGSTGWTATGINLVGPTGPSGPVGGSTDVDTRAGGSGNAVSPASNSYGPQAVFGPSAGVDFWFPKDMAKNAMFIGDPTWATNKLENFGTNTSAQTDQKSVPQLSIIQKETNVSGLNGLMFGAYGATSGATASGLSEGNTGATTNAFDFVHMSFVKPFSSGSYDRMFRIKTFRQKFRIEVGGPLSGASNDQLRDLQLASDQFTWVSNRDGQFLSTATRIGIQTKSNGSMVGAGNMTRSIEMFAKPDLSLGYSTAIYGYIGFQNVEGPLAIGAGNWNPAHGFGNVHIGATAGGPSLGLPIGGRNQYGLGIARPIFEGTGNNDAAIRFYTAGTTAMPGGNEDSAIVGGIRPFTQSISNTSGTFNIRSIQIGSGYAISGTVNPANASRQLGGRIGINNHPGWNDFNSARKINFPVHVNLTGFQNNDKATSPYPSQATMGYIEQWAFGIDYDKVAGETGSYHAGWDTDSPGFGVAYGYGYLTASVGATTRPLILQSYYAGSATINSISDRRNPNLYMQVNNGATTINYSGDISFGNLALGFAPSNFSPATTDAWSKLSINGGITIGDLWGGGWHTKNAHRPYMGISVQGTIVQGATAFSELFSTSVWGASATNTAYLNNYTLSGNGLVSGRNFLSRGFPGMTFAPDFALADLKTGIMYDPSAGNEYIGWLTSPKALPNIVGGPSTIDENQTPKKVAKWANRGEKGYNNNNDYASFTVEDTFSTRPITITTADLNQKLVNTIFPSSATLRCSIWEIPTRSSMVFLDLSGPRGAVSAYQGPNWVTLFGPSTYYLNGEKSGTPPAMVNIRSAGFSLEDGHYDGQTLNLTVLEVDPTNTGTLLPNRPLYTGSLPQNIFPTFVNTDDNIVMAAEPFSVLGIGAYSFTEMPLNTGGSILGVHQTSRIEKDGFNDAYPTPFGPFNTTAPAPSGSLSTAGLVNAINTNSTKWTNRGVLGGTAGPSYPGGFNGQGYGAFYIIPYRSIRFVWRFNSSSGTAGKWYEMGRENLVRPLSRTWDSTEYLNGATQSDPGDGSGDTVDPLPVETCCFLPGTLITMADGTYKAIEDVVVGDLVISVIEGTQEIVENKVIQVVESFRKELFEITLDNGNKFTTTNDHPIWVEGKGWSAVNKEFSASVYKNLTISSINVGDSLFSLDSNPKIVSIENSELESSWTYTFATENVQALNYFAADILAHNKAVTGASGALVQCISALGAT